MQEAMEEVMEEAMEEANTAVNALPIQRFNANTTSERPYGADRLLNGHTAPIGF